MARTRTAAELISDARQRADAEANLARHPDPEVLRYVNQGCAEVYDLLVEARGRSYYAGEPVAITTTSDTVAYDLPGDFYRLVGVRRQDGEALVSYDMIDEAQLSYDLGTATYPAAYQLRGSKIRLLPKHNAGTTILVTYVPSFTDLVDDDDTFDGINGWEEYVVAYAARRMALKDESFELAASMNEDLASVRERIQRLAPNRDVFRPERIADVRGWAAIGRLTRWG